MSHYGFLPVRHRKKSLLLPVCMRRSNQTKRQNRTAERRHDRLSVIGRKTNIKALLQLIMEIGAATIELTHKAGRCASIHSTLGIKAEQFSRQDTGKYSVLVRAVEQAGGRLSTVIARRRIGNWLDCLTCLVAGTGRWPTIIGLWRQRALLEEMVKLSNAARGPLETAVSMSQVTHDVTVFPATALSAGSAQVTRWRWTVVNRAQSKTQKNCVIASSFQDTGTALTNGRLREQRRWCQRIHQCPQRWLHCWLSRDAC